PRPPDFSVPPPAGAGRRAFLFVLKLPAIARAKGGRLVTLNERAERAAAIETATRAASDQLDVALRAMDYARALTLQMQVDRLAREAQQLRRRRWRRATEHQGMTLMLDDNPER